jgi:uncharacterized protein HemX
VIGRTANPDDPALGPQQHEPHSTNDTGLTTTKEHDTMRHSEHPGVGTTPTRPRHLDQRGEGVISMAIAVLILAFLGIALWTGFSALLNDATTNTSRQVDKIGQSG